GTLSDAAHGVAIGASGNVAVVGGFTGTATFDGHALVGNTGGGNMFVVQYGSHGTLLWAEEFGQSNGAQGAQAVAVDGNGNVLLTGCISGMVDFGGGPLQSPAGLQSDIFVTKLSPLGAFVWARRAGGIWNSDTGYAIAADRSGNVVTTGVLQASTDF